MRLIFLLLLLTCSTSLLGQDSIRPEINLLVDSIATQNEGCFIFPSRYGHSQIQRFKKIATNEELRGLMSHLNAVVRSYSFQLLAERNDSMVFSILLDHFTDQETIIVQKQCSEFRITVGDFFLEILTVPNFASSSYELNKSQKKILDSLFIFNPNIKVNARTQLLQNLEPKPEYYQRIREIAIEEKNPKAIIALARFQNPNDIDIIKGLFYNRYTRYEAIYAAREFPDVEFYPMLIQRFEIEWDKKFNSITMRILYQALAQYDNMTTLELFERTVKLENRDRHIYLMLAITRYPKDNFEKLKKTLNFDDDDFKRMDKYNYYEKVISTQ